MIKSLSYGLPFYKVYYIENETSYQATGRQLIINLGKRSMSIEGCPLELYAASIADNAMVTEIDRALVIADYDSLLIDTPAWAESVRTAWGEPDPANPGTIQRTHFYRSAPAELTAGITTKFCFVDAGTPSGIHSSHDQNIDEFHVQIAGNGNIQIFRSSDPSSIYATFPMASGCSHRPIWNAAGNYPWHRYYAVTNSIFAVFSIVR